ncbi:glycosyltransferase family 87 protein [Aliiroseovarius sp. KMU-50]|uniref:Glycosyltransferase family 87 protein n=1 Tax=Aliiroseovarius salicola TaxID=3009082 RepID=A0ABT4VWA4_9RHOB|nr:glycosyltransferase family 87 protein [Aliiroseovarius sp. KMU-50]MDA5092519.1 glycosyltransferase family 87 protein [Aliiroseovarius sp. KMU-50]
MTSIDEKSPGEAQGYDPVQATEPVASLLTGARAGKFVVLLYLGATLYFLMTFWSNWSADFSAYYFAGYFYGLGELDQIYAGPSDVIGPETPKRWAEALALFGESNVATYPFLYPPWTAAVMAPIADLMSPRTAMKALLFINIALLYGSVFLAWRLVGRRLTSLPVWMLMSLPILAITVQSNFALVLGQMQLLVFFLCLLAFERYQAGSDMSGALFLALAACLKITPAAFAIVFLWDRSWKALITFTVASLGGLAVSILWMGWPLHDTFFSKMSTLNGLLFMSNVGVPLDAYLYQLIDLIRGTAPVYDSAEHVVPRPVWVEVIVKPIFVAGLAAIWWCTRKMPRHERVGAQLYALALLVPLAAPLAWVHYFLLPAYLMPALVLQWTRVGIGQYLGFLLAFNLPVMWFLLEAQLWAELHVMLHLMVYVPILFLLLAFAILRPLGGTLRETPGNAG